MADVIVHVDRVSVADVTEDTPEGRGGRIAVFVGKLEAADSKVLKNWALFRGTEDEQVEGVELGVDALIAEKEGNEQVVGMTDEVVKAGLVWATAEGAVEEEAIEGTNVAVVDLSSADSEVLNADTALGVTAVHEILEAGPVLVMDDSEDNGALDDANGNEVVDNTLAEVTDGREDISNEAGVTNSGVTNLGAKVEDELRVTCEEGDTVINGLLLLTGVTVLREAAAA